uniref:Uncharacterized protein n=1 Tax=Timema poppense TaxID=170557 RepID=A0A7R9D1Z4_TIMPO|nr:unnamed protein product [Timema poppensis]
MHSWWSLSEELQGGPAVKLSQFSHDEHGKKIKIHFDHGTTTLGFQYQGGVVLAVDSRATGGQFIGKYNI